jgi:hypothetical protein
LTRRYNDLCVFDYHCLCDGETDSRETAEDENPLSFKSHYFVSPFEYATPLAAPARCSF